MIAVIFEVEPAAGQIDTYLATAAELRSVLATVDGFISVERFQSLSNPEKILSLSFFRDEDAVQQWRNKSEHRDAQSAGRGGIFRDYRLRIARVLRDYSLDDRDDAPPDSKALHPSGLPSLVSGGTINVPSMVAHRVS